jgi:hypothetical protein
LVAAKWNGKKNPHEEKETKESKTLLVLQGCLAWREVLLGLRGSKVRLLDLFCGRWGWSRAFAARGWECVGVDLVEPPEIPQGCEFFKIDVFSLGADLGFGYPPYYEWLNFDFACASSPCEEFSLHGMKHFHPNPPYPEEGIALFNHTRWILEQAHIPYVMENVRAAQQFVGNAVHHCGPFYLWGNAVPPILPQGIQKGVRLGTSGFTGPAQTEWRKKHSNPARDAWSGSEKRAEATAKLATIPPELANCVADYAEALLEQKAVSTR